MTLFKNKYRIESCRLSSWDYASEGMYFVTICTKDRECYFGEIDSGKMRLSPIGEIARSEWYKTPEIRLDMNIRLGEFVVMPNHIHGIIVIGANEFNTGHGRDAMHRVSTDHRDAPNKMPKNQFKPQSKNLASVMRGYKSAVTTWGRKNDFPFSWQGRFHDHVIRTMDEFYRKSEYIINNPVKWDKDRFFRS